MRLKHIIVSEVLSAEVSHCPAILVFDFEARDKLVSHVSFFLVFLCTG